MQREPVKVSVFEVYMQASAIPVLFGLSVYISTVLFIGVGFTGKDFNKLVVACLVT